MNEELVTVVLPDGWKPTIYWPDNVAGCATRDDGEMKVWLRPVGGGQHRWPNAPEGIEYGTVVGDIRGRRISVAAAWSADTLYIGWTYDEDAA